MAALLFLVVMQLAWSFGVSQEARQAGGGAYSYSDSTGQRHSGTYSVRDGQVVHSSGDIPVPFSDAAAFPGYGYGYGFQGYGFPVEDFYPSYLSNLENYLQERYGHPAQKPINRKNPFRRTFHSNLESQRLAFEAASKAFDLSSNQAGYYPNFATRLPQPPYNDFGRIGNFGQYGGYPSLPGFDMHNYPGKGFPNNAYANNGFPNNAYANGGYPNKAYANGGNHNNAHANGGNPNNAYANGGYPNSAFSSAAVGPGYRQQTAAINPENPNNPNFYVNDVNRYSDTSAGGRGNYYSVSSRSFSSSANHNGKQVSHKGAETTVDNNGKVTKFRVGD